MATVEKRYEGKPLDCWDKAKELRLEHYRDIITAKENGKILIGGCASSCLALPAGLGDYVYFGGEPYGATVSLDTPFSIECMEAAEARGISRDMCAYMRNYMGSMFLDRFQFGGEGFPKPDFFFTRNFCTAGHAKWYQLVSDYEGIPVYAYDEPVGPIASEKVENQIDYISEQLYDGIEWMEKITRVTYDDEKLIRALKNFFRTEVLWGEICLLNATVPAPIDLKAMLALMPVSMLRRHEECAVDFMKLLRDEVKERIASGIAAVPTERYRLVTDVSPPWHFLKMLRYVEGYGAVFVGAMDYTINSGEVEFSDEGTPIAAKTPDELGWPLRTREDAVRAVARWTVEGSLHQLVTSREKGDLMLLGLARHWQANAVVLHINRGCLPMAVGLPGTGRYLQRAGYPVMMYEANFGDCRDTDGTQVLDCFDSFLESQKVTRML
ncbi:2-hydroxyacyl-CoA dehydratase subunit D [Chloroflexota bacterium]